MIIKKEKNNVLRMLLADWNYCFGIYIYNPISSY